MHFINLQLSDGGPYTKNVNMKPEEKARKCIDHLLEAAGWEIQDIRDLNLGASLGVAIREFPLKSGHVDYLLFVDRMAVGVVEAKPEGTTLSGVAEQSEKYIATGSENLPQVEEPLPFAYESTGVETFFRDSRDPDTRSRKTYTAVSSVYRLIKLANARRILFFKDHIATSLSIAMDDFESVPFNQKGGAIKAYQVFGQELDKVLEELNEVLVV